MLSLVFGLSLLFFFIVTVGDRLLYQIVRLLKNPEYQKLVLESEQALGLVMVAGAVYMIVFSALATKYQRAFLLLLLYSLVFASAGWKPLHDATWIIKYSSVAYLAAFTGLFIYRNFWRLLSAPYTRLLIAYLCCLSAVALFLGGKTNDYWYASTEIIFILGFSVAWFYQFNNRYGLYEFNKVIAWAAVAVTLTHVSSVVVADEYIVSGRFTSYYRRATGFGVVFSPLVISMFWMAMCHKDSAARAFYSGAAIVGFVLILWSGSRGPTVATIMGVGILWLIFRSKNILVLLFLGGLGIAIQVLFSLSAAVDAGALLERLQDTENSRLVIWIEYLEVALKSPIYGYAPSGYRVALDGSLGEFLVSIGLDNPLGAGIHNSYLGVILRFGFVGLGFFLAVLLLPVYTARRVLVASTVPKFEKETYIFNAAILPPVLFMIFFEDYVPGSGKGTLLSALFYASLIVCHVYGCVLLNKYAIADRGGKEIKTVEGMKTLSDFG